jgi:hypothetical protein
MPADFVNFPWPGTGIIGVLDAKGVVTFAITATKDSPVRGTELFTQMMKHFGDDALAIQAVWRIGFQGTQSINIDKVNELTASGMPLDEAIHHTWTVTRAKKLGFDKVFLLGLPTGVPGAYLKMDVLIEK